MHADSNSASFVERRTQETLQEPFARQLLAQELAPEEVSEMRWDLIAS